MRNDDLIRRIRHLKLRAAAGPLPTRLLVPGIEVCEFWLSHGFREVLLRARLRLTGRTSWPSPVPPPVRSDRPPAVMAIPEADARLTVSILIPVMNQPDLTRRCLESIQTNTPSGTYEVIVIDNASDEPTRQMLAGVPGLRVIRNAVNQGFVGACNQGAAAARGEFVVFLNNDTWVAPGWTEALLRTFGDHDRVGAVGAKLVYPNERLQEAGGIIWSDGDGWNYGRLQDPAAPPYNYVREVDYCSGACLMVRRALFEELGGFDERYAPAYYEDTDLAFRLRERGFRVMYQPAAHVVHYEGATAGTDTSTGFKSFQVVNRLKFLERHAGALAAQLPHDPAQLAIARDRRRGRRILVVDHMVPHHREDAGSVRMMALLRILMDLGHRVTFLPDNLAGIEPYTSELQQLGVEVLYGPSEMDFVARHGHEFDVAILCRARLAAGYLSALRACRRPPFIVFDTVDLHYLREQREAELTGDAARLAAAAATRAIEIDVMRRSDMVWVTSTHEADLLRHESGIPVVELVPVIQGVRYDVPGYGARRDLLFIGGFRHAPNEDAVRYFAEQILPRIRAELADVRFIIVGSHTPPAVKALASNDIVVRGFIDDVEPVFDAVRLSVAPLRYGAGVKGKVTQSLAWGVPAVVTPVAAEGLGLVHGEHVLIAEEPEAFARQVVDLYNNESLWTIMSDAGRRLVESRLGYESVRASVAAILTRT